jgi:hypothetical protein
MEKIKSITEAFSMQPCSFSICLTPEKQMRNNKEFIHEHKGCIKEIKLERLQVGTKCGDPVEELYYVGYGFNGEKMFKYIYNSVNVHYETV